MAQEVFIISLDGSKGDLIHIIIKTITSSKIEVNCFNQNKEISDKFEEIVFKKPTSSE